MLDRRTTSRLTAALLTAGTGVVLLAAPAAAAPCEGYSAVCAETPTAAPTTQPPSQVANNRPGLAATGDEIALLSVVGLGTLAGGTALVVAGRRRRTTATA
jgi:LPXTG-motif cell wall-anchored protein